MVGARAPVPGALAAQFENVQRPTVAPDGVDEAWYIEPDSDDDCRVFRVVVRTVAAFGKGGLLEGDRRLRGIDRWLRDGDGFPAVMTGALEGAAGT